MTDKKIVPTFTLNHKDISGLIAEAVDKAKREIEEELNKEGFLISIEDTLFIHSPVAAQNIRRIIFNGVEFPVKGMREVLFVARVGDLCDLQVNYLPPSQSQEKE